ncbi:MAG: hypothetical protein PHD58_10770 [Anaerolineales bacterium]|nr:hypothetical protein [Anaerolineales bacterium]
MSESTPFLVLEQPCHEAIAWFIQQVSQAGLQVVRTFDMQEACHDPADCPCPRHSGELCDGRIVVMLVYRGSDQPVSLVAHSYQGRTWFAMVDTPQQRADPRLERAIRQALPV